MESRLVVRLSAHEARRLGTETIDACALARAALDLWRPHLTAARAAP